MRLLKTRARDGDDGVAITQSLHTPEAFAEVFDRHFVAIHRYVARRTGRDRADDLVAQTFTLAFSHRGRYRDDLGTARPWLMGIATNLMRAAYRDELRQARTVEKLGTEAWTRGGGSSSDPALEGDHHDHDLANALAKLDPDQRDALLLLAWGELSYAEIAASLRIPIGTVRSRISRACAALRTELDPPAPAPQQALPAAHLRRNHA